MSTTRVRVRFAPSPTGYLHLGNLHTALFNWLFARHHRGSFILRIEDTDFQRSRPEYKKGIIEDLKWLGIDYDEGPEKFPSGNFGPYRQSERLPLYCRYAEKLLKNEKAYECYCSAEELVWKRKEALRKGIMPKYDGKCRHLSKNEKEKLKQGKKRAIRFKVEDREEIIRVNDLIKGEIDFNYKNIGDFIILRSETKDNLPLASYNLAVVVDDNLMRITHVIRGEDHFSNTPRQMLLYQALGFNSPQFAHLPTILAKENTPLSKREAGVSLKKLKHEGFLPEAILNYLALLGWHSGEKKEFMPLSEITKKFSLGKISSHPAIYNPDKLNWINKHYLRNLNVAELLRRGKDFIPEEYSSQKNILAVLETIRDNLNNLKELKPYLEIFYLEKLKIDPSRYPDILDEAGKTVIKLFRHELENCPEINNSEYLNMIKRIASKTGLKGKKLFMPLRLVLTGKTHGPEMEKIIPLISRKILSGRLKEIVNIR